MPSMTAEEMEPAIRSLIKGRNFSALRETFKEWQLVDLASLITGLPEDEQVLIFRVLPHDYAADLFSYLHFYAQERLLKAMAREDVAKIVNEMSPDDRTTLLEELPSDAMHQLMQTLSPEERKIAQGLLGYPEDSIGRLMTPDFIAVHDTSTVKEVLDYIREHGQDKETLNVIYVVNEEGKLIDDVRIREFLLKPLTTKVADIRDSHFIALQVRDSETTAVDAFRKYDRTALPVVDSTGELVGIVTVDDVLDVAEREATEDMQRMGGLEALDEPYTTISLFRMVKKRATWLVILFLGEMLTATAMGYFQNEIEKAVVLALFVPLIISSGGNSGSQASTLIIRAMALGEVTLKDWWSVMLKEIKSGLSLGLILGAIGFLRIAIWSGFSDIYGPHWLLVAITVSLSLVGVVLWGSLSGSMLPFILRKCGLDPATSSAPFVATLVDVTGLIIYFTVAMTILRGTIL
jgi:magnesium transporter